MHSRRSAFLLASALLASTGSPLCAQTAKPAPAAESTTAGADARPVSVPVVVLEKRGPLSTLGKEDFAISVEGKPQVIRAVEHANEVPLTIGLLVDVGRDQTRSLDDVQKAGQTFLDSILTPTAGSRHPDKAFLMQFGRSAELLQDVTDSKTLLATGFKEVGTQAPSADDDPSDDKKPDDNSGRTNTGNTGNTGPYGRSRGGNTGNRGGADQPRSRGTVLYDAVFLASEDVAGKARGRRVLVVLTQGVDRHSKESLKEAIEAAQRTDTVIYAVHVKGEARNVAGANPGARDSGGYGGYPGGGYPGGGYPGGGYPGGGYPYPSTTGGSNGDGTYTDPDGRKILERICTETGGRMFDAKGKGSLDEIFKQISDELHAQYRVTFVPSADAASPGFHRLQLTLTGEAAKKPDIQTRPSYYVADAAGR
jgi:VWFA-related protein